MRGAVALPGSKSTSRAEGMHWKLGDPIGTSTPWSASKEPKPMMHGHGKSDPDIVAEKPPNNAEQSAAGTEGEPAKPVPGVGSG